MPTFSAPDGTTLYYAEDGAGAPLLCLAGLTRDSRDFDYLMPYLAGRRVIRLDSRGRGQSAHAAPETYAIPAETGDVIALLDHLGLASVPIIGTSRGGLIAMLMASFAKDRLSGLCLVDVGPVLEPKGLDAIKVYVGRTPAFATLEEAAVARAKLLPGFANVPHARWMDEARKHYEVTDGGLALTYDPRLGDQFKAGGAQPVPDLWPLFDALEGVPLALIRGANSNILSAETADEMARRRPDMLHAEVPDRGHVPFLDEPESVALIEAWLGLVP